MPDLQMPDLAMPDLVNNNFGAIGDRCGASANGRACAPNLACCYPCGIPNCNYLCRIPCMGPGCVNGCPLIP